MRETRSTLSHCAIQVRKYDRDRFLCALFFPEVQREKLFTLFAFNLEIAAIAETVSEPMLGLIRLAWWREAIDEIYAGKPLRNHPVLQALAPLIKEGLEQDYFHSLLSAREKDLDPEPFPTMDEFYHYIQNTSCAILQLAAQSIGFRDTETIDKIGMGWGFVGMLRAIPHQTGRGRQLLPPGTSEETILIMAQQTHLLIERCTEQFNSFRVFSDVFLKNIVRRNGRILGKRWEPLRISIIFQLLISR